MKLTLQPSGGTPGTLATPPLNATLRVNPLGQVTMIDDETLGSVSLTVSVPPLGAAGFFGAELVRLELLDERRRLLLDAGFSGFFFFDVAGVLGRTLRRVVGGCCRHLP